MKMLADRITALEQAATPAQELGVVIIPHGLSPLDREDYIASEIRRRGPGGGGLVILPAKGGRSAW